MSERDDMERGDVEETLERLFVGDDSTFDDVDAGRLFETIAEDDDAREQFDRIARVDRELDGEFESRFAEAQVLSAVDDMLDTEQTGDEEADDGRGSAQVVELDARRPRWQGVVALAAAVLVGVGIYATIQATGDDPRAPQDDEFRARSARAMDDVEPDAPELRVFCVERAESGEVSFRGASDFPLDVVECDVDDELKLGIVNRDEDLKYAAFFGVGVDGTMYWYGPSPAAPDPVAIDASPDVQPIGETIRLRVNHTPGPVRVHAVFAPSPLRIDDVERLVDEQSTNLSDRPSIDPGTIPGVATSVVFEVAEANP